MFAAVVASATHRFAYDISMSNVFSILGQQSEHQPNLKALVERARTSVECSDIHASIFGRSLPGRNGNIAGRA
jgi:hypothetical protein